MLMRTLFPKPEPKRDTSIMDMHIIPLQSRRPIPHRYPRVPRSFPGFPPPLPVERPVTLQGLPPIILNRIVKYIPDFETLESTMLSCRKLYYVVISTPNILHQISCNYFPYRSIQLIEIWRKGNMTADAKDLLRASLFSEIPILSFVSLDPKRIPVENEYGDVDIGRKAKNIQSAEVRRMRSDYWKARCIAALSIVAELMVRAIDAQCAAHIQFDNEFHPEFDLGKTQDQFKRHKIKECIEEYQLVMKEMLARRLTPEEFIEYFESDGRFETPSRYNSHDTTIASPTRTEYTISGSKSPDRSMFEYEMEDVKTVPNSPVPMTEVGDSSFITNLSNWSRDPGLFPPTQVLPPILSMAEIVNALFLLLISLKDYQFGRPVYPWSSSRGRFGPDGPPADKVIDNITRFASNQELHTIQRFCDVSSRDQDPRIVLDDVLSDLLAFAVLDLEEEFKDWDD